MIKITNEYERGTDCLLGASVDRPSLAQSASQIFQACDRLAHTRICLSKTKCNPSNYSSGQSIPNNNSNLHNHIHHHGSQKHIISIKLFLVSWLLQSVTSISVFGYCQCLPARMTFTFISSIIIIIQGCVLSHICRCILG